MDLLPLRIGFGGYSIFCLALVGHYGSLISIVSFLDPLLVGFYSGIPQVFIKMGLVRPLRVPSLLKPQQAQQCGLPSELQVLLTTVNREQYRLCVGFLFLLVLSDLRGFTFHEYDI